MAVVHHLRNPVTFLEIIRPPYNGFGGVFMSNASLGVLFSVSEGPFSAAGGFS